MVLTNCKRSSKIINIEQMFGIKGDEIMKNYDEILFNMINEDTIDIILQILKDYLSQHES